jgi:phosphate-selective porin
VTGAILAQEGTTPPGQSTNEVDSLRKKLEEQQEQINRLQQTLQRQSEVIAQQQSLLNALQEKIERANQPTLTPAVAVPAPVPVQAAAETTAVKAPAKAAQGVEAGFGKIKFNGLMQGWYAAGDGGFRDTFRLRRSELKFSGEITPQVKWGVMLDLAKGLSVNNSFTTINGTRVLSDTSVNQASRILQDFYITLDYIKDVHIDVGQYKIPLSFEGLQSSAELDTVERALFITDRERGGAYGDIRDTGLMIRGPIGKQVDYQVGFFNGSGENQNDVDKNDQKAVIGRLVVRPPFIRGLHLGGSGVWGNGQRFDRPRRDRLGGELLYTRDRFKFKSEAMSGRDGDFHRFGYYTHFGYRLTPKVEAIFRFDVFDPDTRREINSASVTERDYIAGFNYYVTENHVKLQVNYLRKTFHNEIVPSRNLVLVNLQTAW